MNTTKPPNKHTKPGRPYVYPWDDWLTGDPTLLRPGKEYHCSEASMCVGIRTRAAFKGVRVSVYSKGDGLILIVPRGPKEKTNADSSK